MRKHKFHYAQNIKSPKADARLNATKGKAVITKQIPYFQCYLSVTVATLQPFNGLKNDPNLFVCSGIPQL